MRAAECPQAAVLAGVARACNPAPSHTREKGQRVRTRRGRTTPDLFPTDTPDPAAREAILAGSLSFTAARAGSHEARLLAVPVGDPATGGALGGLCGTTSSGWLFVEPLFVPETLRGSGLGASLMRRAEQEAVRRGCRGAWLDTFSFQARGFYERLGYAVFGTIQDHPPGHRRHFMQKTF